MLKKLLRPWWTTMLMGVLLIVCAIVIFNNPEATMLTVAFYLGLLVLLSGIAGFVSYLFSEKEEKSTTELLSGIINLIFGFMMISKTLIAIKALTIVFGLLILSNGLWLVSYAWRKRSHFSFWWLAALLGLAAFSIGVKCILDFETGVETMSNWIGIGVLLSGVGLLLLGYIKHRVVKNVKEKLQTIKEKNV